MLQAFPRLRSSTTLHEALEARRPHACDGDDQGGVVCLRALRCLGICGHLDDHDIYDSYDHFLELVLVSVPPLGAGPGGWVPWLCGGLDS